MGQAIALNEDGSFNSADQPAARGSIVTLFATGEGAMTADPPIQVQVGTAQAEILSARRSPAAGLFEIRLRLPGIFTQPGVRPLTLSIGFATSQPGVTIAVN